MTVAGLPVGTAALLVARDDLALGSVLLLYLLAVVVIAAVGGLLPGIVSAALSFGLANWFFTPPFHTLAVAGRDALVELIVFAAAAVTVSAIVEVAARYQRQLADQAARTRELAAEDRARAALLAAVGHDLRTPLASVKVAVSSLRQQDVVWDTEAQAGLLATIEESADRLSSLVTNLLDVTRLRADSVTARMMPVALDEVVARALLNEHHPTVRVDVADDLPLVLADPGLLERVVANLVENAVRFSPEQVAVDVRAELTSVDEQGADTPAAAVLLHVVDHGPGVPPEHRDQLFVPFRRLDDRGPGSHVGLGLAIVRGFAEAMGGTIRPSTTPGGGLTMTVTLPVAAG
jgi:two-component system, OmpR family, sensor histidine kinase KdpD